MWLSSYYAFAMFEHIVLLMAPSPDLCSVSELDVRLSTQK